MSHTITPQWTVADRVRKARQVGGFDTQEALADAAGVSRQTISNAELGKRRPHKLVLHAIADACNVSYEWLTGESDIARELTHPLGREHQCDGQLDLLAAAA